MPARAEGVRSRGRGNKVPGASPRPLSRLPGCPPHSSRRQWLPNSCGRSSLGRPARARARCARGSPRTLASSISPAATSCGRTSKPTRVRGMWGRGAGVNPRGIRLGRGDERTERGRVSSAPGRPSPARVWLCRLLRAGAHAVGDPQPCGLTAPGEEADASWEEGRRCTRLLSPPGLLLRWGKAVTTQLSEN